MDREATRLDSRVFGDERADALGVLRSKNEDAAEHALPVLERTGENEVSRFRHLDEVPDVSCLNFLRPRLVVLRRVRRANEEAQPHPVGVEEMGGRAHDSRGFRPPRDHFGLELPLSDPRV